MIQDRIRPAQKVFTAPRPAWETGKNLSVVLPSYSGKGSALCVLAVSHDFYTVHVIVKNMLPVRFKILLEGTEELHKACLVVEGDLYRTFHKAAQAGYGQNSALFLYLSAVSEDISAGCCLRGHFSVISSHGGYGYSLKFVMEIGVNDCLSGVQHEVIPITPCGAVLCGHPPIAFF